MFSRLHVAVDDLVGVGVLQGARDAQGQHRAELGHECWALAQQRRQRRPDDELGDEVVEIPVVGRVVVDLGDVPVGQARDRLGLSREALAGLRVAREVAVQHLHGHVAVQRVVVAAVDHAHAAGADLLEDSVFLDALEQDGRPPVASAPV
ncbi:MAG: hypothetical protein R3F39_17435 [Myxococcota bacterium]